MIIFQRQRVPGPRQAAPEIGRTGPRRAGRIRAGFRSRREPPRRGRLRGPPIPQRGQQFGRGSRLTAARVLHYRWRIPAERAQVSPASPHSAVSNQVDRNGQRRTVVHPSPRGPSRGRPDRTQPRAKRLATRRRATTRRGSRAPREQGPRNGGRREGGGHRRGRGGKGGGGGGGEPRRPRLPQRDVADDEPYEPAIAVAVADGEEAIRRRTASTWPCSRR